jgi:hypothetical protein
LPPVLEERARAGVLGMPGRCSHEKGTVEARSGEGRNRWKGDGDGAKKENGDDDGEAAKEALALDGRRRRRRRRGVAAAEAPGVAGAGGVEEVGIDGCVLCCVCWWRWGS